MEKDNQGATGRANANLPRKQLLKHHVFVHLCDLAIVRFIIAIIISATGHYYVKNDHWVVVQRQYTLCPRKK